MLENLVTSLLQHQEIKTTLQKAKAAQRLADRVITLGKTDTLAARRQAFSHLQDRTLISKLFKEVAPRFKDRKGGYTRILHLDRRKGDGAQLALLELTEKEIKVKAAPKKSRKKTDAHKGHDHTHTHEHEVEAEGTEPTKAGDAHKHGLEGKDKPQPGQKGFFKNIGKFFRNKGGA